MPINPSVRALLELIGKVEAGKRGYNAIYLPAERKLGPQLLTKMSLADVYALQTRMLKANAKSTAVGRYQFLRKTLTRIVAATKVNVAEKFDADLQDRLALHLMEERGLSKHLAGRLSRTAFANNLAKEWASLPVVTAINGKKIGQSYYAGDGLNHALVKPEKILALVDALGAAQKPVAKPAAVPVDRPKPVEAVQVPALGYDREQVRVFQRLLLGHGYVTVGGVDGLVGNSTRSVVRDFRAANGLPEGDHLDDDLLAALKRPDAIRPVIMPDRANATLSDLRDKDSEIVKGTDWQKVGTAGAAAGTAVKPVSDIFTDSGEEVSGFVDTLTPFQSFIAFFSEGAWVEWIWVPVLIIVGIVGWKAFAIARARLRDHRLNNTAIVNLKQT